MIPVVIVGSGGLPVTVSPTGYGTPMVAASSGIAVTFAANGLPVVGISAGAPAAPVNTVVPIIGGTPAVGQVLSSSNGTWTGSPLPTYTRQWKRGAVAYATWSTTDKSANMTVSNGDLKVTATSGISGGARSTGAQSSGKFYFEVLHNTVPGGSAVGPGLVKPTINLGTFAGDGVGGVYIIGSTGGVFINGSNVGSIGAASAVGQTICFAVDLVNYRLWVRINSGIWNNSAPADPATNVGGFNIATVFTGFPVHAFWGANQNTNAATANFGASAFSGAVPAGFTSGWPAAVATDIPGATAQTYLQVAADYNTTITVTVTATNSQGSASATSASTAAVAGSLPVNTVLPSISGMAAEASTLTAADGTWTGTPTPTLARVWKRDGVTIGGATAATYLLVPADVGTTITVTVTGTNTAGSSSATSGGVGPVTGVYTGPVNTVLPTIDDTTPGVGQLLTATSGTWTGTPTITYAYQWIRSAVVAVLPANTVLPAVTGTAIVGSTLTTTNGTWTGTPTPTYARQWKRGGTAISGETGLTYLLAAPDIGTNITCTVTATNTAGSVDATSNSVGPIASVSTTTWDDSIPGTTIRDITLTNGKLTATANLNGSGPGVMAASSKSTGKYYFEAHIDAFAVEWWIGIVNAGGNIVYPPGVYDDHGAGYRASDGLVVKNGFATAGNVQPASVGGTICVALDASAGLIWFRVNGGNWNNSGTANPATGVGGLNVAGGTFAPPYFPKWTGGGNLNDACTVNFGGSAYAFSVPAGFGNW